MPKILAERVKKHGEYEPDPFGFDAEGWEAYRYDLMKRCKEINASKGYVRKWDKFIEMLKGA